MNETQPRSEATTRRDGIVRPSSILAALGGGQRDRAILDAAQRMSGAETRISALHVVDVPDYGIFGDEVVAWHTRLLNDIEDRVTRELHDKTREVGLDDVDIVVHRGRTYAGILDSADTLNADLVVAGGGEKKGADAWPVGTRARRLVEGCPRPILVVARPGSWESIVVPVTFSDLSRAAVEVGAGLAARWGLPLHVVHVFSQTWPEYTELEAMSWWDTGYAGVDTLARVRGEARDHLDAFVAACDTGDCDVGIELLTGSAPGYEVARFVSEETRPLLVMGSLGRQKRRGVLVGSTAEAIFRSTACDMLTFKG